MITTNAGSSRAHWFLVSVRPVRPPAPQRTVHAQCQRRPACHARGARARARVRLCRYRSRYLARPPARPACPRGRTGTLVSLRRVTPTPRSTVPAHVRALLREEDVDHLPHGDLKVHLRETHQALQVLEQARRHAADAAALEIAAEARRAHRGQHIDAGKQLAGGRRGGAAGGRERHPEWAGGQRRPRAAKAGAVAAGAAGRRQRAEAGRGRRHGLRLGQVAAAAHTRACRGRRRHAGRVASRLPRRRPECVVFPHVLSATAPPTPRTRQRGACVSGRPSSACCAGASAAVSRQRTASRRAAPFDQRPPFHA